MKNQIKIKRLKALFLAGLITFSGDCWKNLPEELKLKPIINYQLSIPSHPQNQINSFLEPADKIKKIQDPIDEYLEPVYKNSKKNETISKDLIRAIIKIESGGKRNVVGTSGEKGLMQIMPGTWNDREKEISFDEGAFNPYENIRVGIKQLNWLYEYCEKRNENWGKLLIKEKQKLIAAAYNAGALTLWKRNWNINEMPLITQNYIKKLEEYLTE